MKKTTDPLDRDLDQLVEHLPEILRDDWVVVPRHLCLQVWIVGMLIGAAAALTAVGFALEVGSLRWAWPGVIAALMLATRFWPWWRGDRALAQLRQLGRGPR